MGRRCCCGGGCWEITDDFNRADSTNIGSVLTEQAGDSEIRSNRLWMPASSLVYSAEHRFRKKWGNVYATAANTVENGVYRLGINFDAASPGTYLWGQLTQNATDYTVLTSAGHTDTFPGPPGENIDLRLCFSGRDPGLLSFWVAFNTYHIWSPVSPGPGYRTCLANPGSVAINFDDFKFQEHFLGDAACPDCGCACDHYGPTKGSLTATITNTSGCMTMYEGAELIMPLYSNAVDAGPSYLSTGNWCDHQLLLECAPDSEWKLTWMGGEGSCDGWSSGAELCPLGPCAFPAAVTCNPFSMTFGPFEAGLYTDPVGCPLPCCYDPEEPGQYTIVITE